MDMDTSTNANMDMSMYVDIKTVHLSYRIFADNI
jgi:hypothetical protein